MSDATSPSVVLVHGAFADASSWNGVIERLQAEGVAVTAPANPLRGIATDSAYEVPEPLQSNHWGVAGEWTIGREKAVLDEAGGSIAYRFDARDAHVVLSPGARDPIPFRGLVDGEAPGRSHRADVDEDGNGLLADGRLYQLVRERDRVRERTLEISFLEPGAEAYAFTSG